MQFSTQVVFSVALISFCVSCVLTYLFRRIAIFIGIFDHPNQPHKTHIEPIPYLGGFSIIITVILGIFTGIMFEWINAIQYREVLILISAPLLLAVVGLIDDFRGLGAISRLSVQTVSALVVSLLFIKFGWLGSPTNSQIFNLLATVFWIVGITNSLNFIDNLDGGAGGIVIISSVTLAVASILGNQIALAAISVLLAGACFGFLVWNLNPARIYLGDSGALFLGSILAVLTIRLEPNTTNSLFAWFFAVLVFAVPILDTSIAVVSRVLRGISPLKGGRDHLSHILLNFGFSKRKSASTIWLLQVYFSVLGLLLLVLDSNEAYFVVWFSALSFLSFYYLFMRLSRSIVKH